MQDKTWNNNDISKLPAYKLQKRVPKFPHHVFLFGAGASFGSDASHLAKQGKLPPLGKNLFEALHSDTTLEFWNKIPSSVKNIFQSKSFEEAMDELDNDDDWAKESLKRDQDLSRYFSRFCPEKSNLYWKLAKSISRRLRNSEWSGAIITTNYERLIEESLMRNSVFTVVKGITFFDDRLPPLTDDQLFEICYPHGACQFFLGQNWYKGSGNIVFGKEAKMLQKSGVNHLLIYSNIEKACDLQQIPMICRYQSSKRPSVKNYFIDSQQERTIELILNSKIITIVGVFCSHINDKHIWEALEKTPAFINYVNSSQSSNELFKTWATANGKEASINYLIIPKTFRDAFKNIFQCNDLG
jgi:hypothetical protein